MEQVGVVSAVNTLPVTGRAAELGAAGVKVGSGVTRVGIEEVDAGDESGELIGYVGALEASCAVCVGTQVG
ncbi:MAG: hypothetical protein QOF89_4059 [Acidobacteriota bacterium]|nr:hypothetical protein [Acidobacteriota bacterium]